MVPCHADDSTFLTLPLPTFGQNIHIDIHKSINKSQRKIISKNIDENPLYSIVYRVSKKKG